jgi:hypothetical protein
MENPEFTDDIHIKSCFYGDFPVAMSHYQVSGLAMVFFNQKYENI